MIRPHVGPHLPSSMKNLNQTPYRKGFKSLKKANLAHKKLRFRVSWTLSSANVNNLEAVKLASRLKLITFWMEEAALNFPTSERVPIVTQRFQQDFKSVRDRDVFFASFTTYLSKYIKLRGRYLALCTMYVFPASMP